MNQIKHFMELWKQQNMNDLNLVPEQMKAGRYNKQTFKSSSSLTIHFAGSILKNYYKYCKIIQNFDIAFA